MALGVGAIASGSDLGGSLRYPAYCCGIATIRPSFGRVPHHNATLTEERAPSTQFMSVQGPMARTVRDVRLGLAVMSARNARDPWWVPAPLEGPKLNPPIRVALCIDPFGDGVEPAVAEAVKAAGKHLAEAGYAVEDMAPPLCAEAADTFGKLSFTETRATAWEAMDKLGTREIAISFGASAEMFPALDLAGYIRTLADRTRILRAWSLFQENYPLVLMPVSARPPFAGEDAAGKAEAQAIFRAKRFLVMVNLLGLPSAAVPTGIAGGLPMGVQIVGPRLRDDLCLDAAEAIEQRGLPTPIDPVGSRDRSSWRRTQETDDARRRGHRVPAWQPGARRRLDLNHCGGSTSAGRGVRLADLAQASVGPLRRIAVATAVAAPRAIGDARTVRRHGRRPHRRGLRASGDPGHAWRSGIVAEFAVRQPGLAAGAASSSPCSGRPRPAARGGSTLPSNRIRLPAP